MTGEVDKNRKGSDVELLAACAAVPPDLEAWETLYKRFRSIVETRIAKMSDLPRAQIEELRQETFLRIFTRLPKLESTAIPLGALVMRITMSVVIDHWRRTLRESTLTEPLADEPLSIRGESKRYEIPEEAVEGIFRQEADRFSNPLDRQIARLWADELKGGEIILRSRAGKHTVYRVRDELRARVRSALAAFREQEGMKSRLFGE